MDTKINITGNNCCEIVLQDGTINIPKGSHITIDENGRIDVDGIPLGKEVKSLNKTQTN